MSIYLNYQCLISYYCWIKDWFLVSVYSGPGSHPSQPNLPRWKAQWGGDLGFWQCLRLADPMVKGQRNTRVAPTHFSCQQQIEIVRVDLSALWRKVFLKFYAIKLSPKTLWLQSCCTENAFVVRGIKQCRCNPLLDPLTSARREHSGFKSCLQVYWNNYASTSVLSCIYL